MKAKVLTFSNFKGGTGKTTNSTMTGIELARRGYKTLLIDLDPQGNATNLYLKTKENVNGELVVFKKTLMSAIRDKDLDSAIINIIDNLYILPSSADFALYPRYMENIKEDYSDRVKYLSQLAPKLFDKYDFMLIDVPPTISLITDSALYMTDYAIVVLQTQERSLQGAQAFIKYMQEEVINEFQAPRLDLLGILPVLLKNGAPVDESTLTKAQEIFGKENIFNITIKNMERLKRYDVTGVTFKDQFDKSVQKVYSDVVDELFTRMEYEDEQPIK
ncbi:ParA family protein [Bombilactobacillus bombi]|uniref:ParA family protein n=1 Tax=Bombilactobacillus bombi TaxID=1303590 RepID=A0A3R6VFU7_9LACO|nr:AAA family ATPase [Bombilactobacillus bombi]RHW45297.1 ParA family protein [Bombilactobacillus bombi]